MAGLSAAIYLHRAGHDIEILEASNGVGGRVRSDYLDGYTLDRGFQVLQTAYPEAKRLLDYEALQLESFYSGSIKLKSQGVKQMFVDPQRHPQYIFDMLFTDTIRTRDLLRTYRMKQNIKSKSIEAIFDQPFQTSIEGLRSRKMTDLYIREFWLPFYGGVFFDSDLKTDMRQLDFTFKMFAEGTVALPQNGMQAIGDQLASLLPEGCISLNTRVHKIENKEIELDNKTITADCIIDTRPELHQEWRGTTTVYFTADESPFDGRFIALNAQGKGRISNIAILSAVQKSYAPEGKHLIAVSMPSLEPITETDFIYDVKREIKTLLETDIKNWEHLRTYRIPIGLPKLSESRHNRSADDWKQDNGYYRAGDFMLNGSINGALRSGRLVAESIIKEYS